MPLVLHVVGVFKFNCINSCAFYSPFLHYRLVSSFQKSILEIQVTKTTLTSSRVGVIKIVIVINCNLITFFKIIENNCNSVFALITIIEM